MWATGEADSEFAALSHLHQEFSTGFGSRVVASSLHDDHGVTVEGGYRRFQCRALPLHFLES